MPDNAISYNKTIKILIKYLDFSFFCDIINIQKKVVKLKSHEVLTLLRISRPTLTKYVKTGAIKATALPNGQYDYDKQ
jgi:hypothetical protein